MKLKQVIVKRMYLYPTILAVFMLMNKCFCTGQVRQNQNYRNGL